MIIKHKKATSTTWHEVVSDVNVHTLRKGESLMVSSGFLGTHKFSCQHVVITEEQDMVLPVSKGDSIEIYTNHGALVGDYHSLF